MPQHDATFVAPQLADIEEEFERFNLDVSGDEESAEQHPVTVAAALPDPKPVDSSEHQAAPTNANHVRHTHALAVASSPSPRKSSIHTDRARPLPQIRKQVASRKLANDVHVFLQRSKTEPHFRDCVLCLYVLI